VWQHAVSGSGCNSARYLRQKSVFAIGVAWALWRAEDDAMTAPDAALPAVERLVDLARAGRLPFAFYEHLSREGRVEIAVSRLERRAAIDFLAEHPVSQPDGSAIPVDIRVMAGSCWISEPVRGRGEQADVSALEGLIGLDVNEAALRANAGGWLVRAFEPQAALTLDMRRNRANLEFSESGEVISVHAG
jgi:hypothetical protein